MPPAVGRLGARLDRIGAGSTTVHLPMTGELLLTGGRPSAAGVAMVADVALTTAVVASLPGAEAVTTIAMTLDLLRPPPAEGELVAESQAAPYAGGAPQHCSGTIHAADGDPVAVISGWFVPNPVDAAASDQTGVVVEPAAPDVGALLGWEEVAAGRRLVARDALSNVAGTLHGGVGALACVVAAEEQLGADYRVLQASLGYLRPTPRDGAVTVQFELVRRGRRTATARSALVDDGDRLLLQAAVTAVAS